MFKIGEFSKLVRVSTRMLRHYDKCGLLRPAEKEIPAINVLSLREVVGKFEDEPAQWDKMWAFIKQNGIDCKRTGYSVYHDDEYKDEDVDMEIAVPVSVLGENKHDFVYKELEAIPLAATIQFPGPYDNYNKAMEKLAVWIEQNGYEFAGLIRGHGIVMPGDGVAFEDSLTELQVPVRKV